MGFLVMVWNPLKLQVKHGTELWIYSSASQPEQCLKKASLWIPPAQGSLSQNHLSWSVSAYKAHKPDLHNYVTTDIFREGEEE